MRRARRWRRAIRSSRSSSGSKRSTIRRRDSRVSGIGITGRCSRMRSDVKLLWGLLALFCMRVLGQALVAVAPVSFLPPMEDWFSGVIAYPILLAVQVSIIALFAKICVDLTRESGYFARPRPTVGAFLTVFGSTYLAEMIIRYIMRMSLYTHEQLTGGSIPTRFA